MKIDFGKYSSPTGQAPNKNRALKRVRTRMRLAAAEIRPLLDNFRFETKRVPAEQAPSVPKSQKRGADLKANATIYEWELDPVLMDQTMSRIRAILAEAMLDSTDDTWSRRWWMSTHLDAALEDGTTDALVASQMAADGIVSAETQRQLDILTAEAQLMQTQYLRRVQLVQGRVFSQLKSITGDMEADLRRTLVEGMTRGLGVRDLKGMLNARIGVGLSSAERLVRTEIGEAYRTAYREEMEDLNKNLLDDEEYHLGILHQSAFASTSRRSHMQRSGTVHSKAEQEDWYSKNGNRINCLCSEVAVMISKSGKIHPAQAEMVKRFRQRSQQYGKEHGIL